MTTTDVAAILEVEQAKKWRLRPMNAQDEIERLKREVDRLQKQIATQQNLAPLPHSLIDNYEFVADLARYAEGLFSEADVKKKYHFDEDTWSRLGEDDALVERIEEEKVRRTRNGDTKRELAQRSVVKAPAILENILLDPKANAKHRIDSAKVLDTLAANGPQAAQEEDRVVITINLGADTKLVFDKAVKPTPPNDPKLLEHDNNTPGLPGFAV
jgi:hypothetical protein